MSSYFIYTKNRDNALSEMKGCLNLENEVHILPTNHKKYHASNGLFEANLIEWCKEFSDNNKNFLDIGAHSGTYSICLSKYFNNVHSFEPQRDTFYALCGGVVLSNIKNVECHRVALGSKDQVGEIDLNIVSEDGGGSSVLSTHHQVLKTEKVNLYTLDSYNIKNIGFIKMDVEGNEYDVILGGISTLEQSNFPKILFESNNGENKAIDLLKKIGYSVSNIIGYSNMFLAHKG